MVELGHEVHLLCQDREARALPWVDALGTWEDGELRVEVLREPVRCTVYTPAIGRVLPVYVADRYEGFDAKPFQDLTDAELDHYIAANVEAVRRGRGARPARGGAGEPPGHGAGRAGPRGASVRREDPRQRAGVHGEAPPGPVHAARARGPGPRGGRAGRLAAHGREPVGRPRRRGAARPNSPRAARGGRAHIPAPAARRSAAGPARAGRPAGGRAGGGVGRG